MVRPKIEKEALLLSVIKKCEVFIKRTYKKAEETLELKLIEPREYFHFKLPISHDGSWMISLTSVEVYNSIFNITEKNNKLELYTNDFDKLSFEGLNDELEENLNISDITPSHLQHEKSKRRVFRA